MNVENGVNHVSKPHSKMQHAKKQSICCKIGCLVFSVKQNIVNDLLSIGTRVGSMNIIGVSMLTGAFKWDVFRLWYRRGWYPNYTPILLSEKLNA